MDIDKIINIVRESKINEEMMSTGSTAGAPGFSSKADAEGPVAGYDKPLGKKKKGEPTIIARGLMPGARKRWRKGLG
tara:strand:+ start:357 stop:587 length:231 start_codon:yes stop_codon:yes gene_type:complete